jgi:heme exporter protein CcmD
MAEFLSMGGYGAYVWSAWGISLTILGLLIWQSYSKRKALEKTLVKQIAREVIMMQSDVK